MEVKVERKTYFDSCTYGLECIGGSQRDAVTDVIFFEEFIGFLARTWRLAPRVSVDCTRDPKTQEAEHSQAHEDHFLLNRQPAHYTELFFYSHVKRLTIIPMISLPVGCLLTNSRTIESAPAKTVIPHTTKAQ